MKVIKKILSVLAWVLIIGGITAGVVIYMINKSALTLALKEPAVQASLRILTQILICAAAVVIGLTLLSASLRIGLSIRSKEKEKERKEAELAQSKAKEETQTPGIRKE
ncbi:MAG: hypothetical protein IKF51_09215 [Solobacterium sp.]|nr:hypothetical protein [Solobacterium sp.]